MTGKRHVVVIGEESRGVGCAQRLRDRHDLQVDHNNHLHFDQVSDPSRFAETGAGRHVEFECVRGYARVQVFAPRHVACICFEPMNSPLNALSSGTGLRMPASAELRRTRFSIRVRDVCANG